VQLQGERVPRLQLDGAIVEGMAELVTEFARVPLNNADFGALGVRAVEDAAV
jgi:hypothetical protein